jgi:hypothetical protein
VQFRAPENIRAQAEQRAAAEGKSLSALARDALEQYLDVEDFPAQGSDDPPADGICSARPRRAGENPDAVRLEHGVEGVGEMACTIPDQELD